MMKFEERPYQQGAIAAAIEAMECGKHALIQQPTGAGKAFEAAETARRLIDKYGLNISILVEQENLVRQLIDTVQQVTGIEPGVVCAGVSKQVDWSRKITIGTRQTAVSHVHKAPAQHVLIADEAHRWKLQKEGEPPSGQFAEVWGGLRAKNPSIKLLGFTATPYTLSHGWIFGKNNKEGFQPYFEELTYRTTYKELFDIGKLCVPEIWEQDEASRPDTSGITKVGLEYNNLEAGRVMLKYTDCVRHVLEERIPADGYKMPLVFAQNIECVEEYCRAVPGLVPIHSKLPEEEAMDNMARFMAGKTRGVVSVMQLSIGFDFKPADAVVLARLTEAPAIVLQQCGRGARISPETGKTKFGIYDIVGNLAKHLEKDLSGCYDFDNPIVKVPRASKKTGEFPVKACPGYLESGEKCPMTDLHAAVRVCPECGEKFTAESVEELMPNLKKVTPYQQKEPERMIVESMSVREYQGRESFKLEQHQGTAAVEVDSKGFFKRWMIRIVIKGGGFFTQESASLLLMFPDYYNGFPVDKSRKIWKQLSDDPYPENVEDAAFLLERARQPVEIEYQEKGGYRNVTQMFFEDKKAENISTSYGDDVSF